MYLSKRAQNLQESAIRKLDTAVQSYTDVSFFRLNIGQPDIKTHPAIRSAIQNWDIPVIAYGPASGTPQCREAFAQYHQKWQPKIRSEHIAVTTGGSEALLFAFTAICDPGDEILVPAPYYTNYNGFATIVGARVRPILTRLEDGFALPSNAELDTLKTKKTRAFLFSNPSNPTGAVYNINEIQRIARWCHKNNIYFISDEVYRRIWFEEPPASALSLEAEKEAVIVIDSLSKTWSACGLRIGAFISRNTALMEKIERLGQARLGPQPLAQTAGIAALTLEESYYEEVRLQWKKRVDVLFSELNTIPGILHNKPQGAFYTMVELPIPAENFAQYLIHDFRDEGQSLVVAPGGGFYEDPEHGYNQIRLAAVLEPPKIKRAIELLKKALDQYPKN
jgi:aspartate aminotransferase